MGKKEKGAFGRIALAAAMALSSMKAAIQSRGRSEVGSYRQKGRDGFMAVSSPRCHTQKKVYKGFAR
jgi:hypothetical protein